MKAAKLKAIEQRLLDKRRELMSEVRDRNATHLEPAVEGAQDIADQASTAYTKEFLLSIGGAERRLLREVDAALEKIRRKTYGTCERCGEPISERRLEALPFARLCIQCAEEEERQAAGLPRR